MKDYIFQDGRASADCCIIALCNARRFYGMGSPIPETGEWESLIDVAGARFGGATKIEDVAFYLGPRFRRDPGRLYCLLGRHGG